MFSLRGYCNSSKHLDASVRRRAWPRLLFVLICISSQIFSNPALILASAQSDQTSDAATPERPQQFVPPLSPEIRDPLFLRAYQAAKE